MSGRPIGSVREVAPGVFRVEVAHGRDPVTGKKLRSSETVHGTPADAERVKARLLLDVGRVPAGARMTLAEYVRDMWLPSLEVRRRTKDGYTSKMDLYVLPTLGHLRLDGIEPYVLDRWLAGLKVSPRSRLHAYRVLNTAMRRAVRWRLIESNPLDAVDPPKVRREPPDVLTAKEANAYLDAFAGHELEAIVTIAIACGLRRSELCALDWSDVDLKAGTVRIRRGYHERGGECFFEEPKSETSRRTVHLPAWAVASLRPLRGLGPLAARGGARMRPSAVSAAYDRHVERCELRRVPMKQLRHTSATLTLASGVDAVVVSRRLGHSSVAVTDSFYLAPGSAADKAAAVSLEGLRKPAAKRGRRPSAARK